MFGGSLGGGAGYWQVGVRGVEVRRMHTSSNELLFPVKEMLPLLRKISEEASHG